MAQRPRFPAWARSTDEVLQHYKVDLEGGLTSDQVPSLQCVRIRGTGTQLLEAQSGQTPLTALPARSCQPSQSSRPVMAAEACALPARRHGLQHH